jgi:hypothetical protein
MQEMLVLLFQLNITVSSSSTVTFTLAKLPVIFEPYIIAVLLLGTSATAVSHTAHCLLAAAGKFEL